MHVNGKFQTPAALCLKKELPPSPKFDNRLVWPRSQFGLYGEETNLFHCLESNADSPVVQSVAYSGTSEYEPSFQQYFFIRFEMDSIRFLYEDVI